MKQQPDEGSVGIEKPYILENVKRMCKRLNNSSVLHLCIYVQFPTMLNGPLPVHLPNVDAPSPLLLSSSSHKSWYHPEHQGWPNWTRLKCLKMKYTGGWFPPSLIILLIWALFRCIYFHKKQDFHFKALDISFCILQVHNPSCSFRLSVVLLTFEDFYLSFQASKRTRGCLFDPILNLTSVCML